MINKIALLLILLVFVLCCCCVAEHEPSRPPAPQPVPNPPVQPIPLPPQPIPPQPAPAPVSPIMPEDTLEWEVIRSKETIPHNKESSVRLYIRLKPNFVTRPKIPTVPPVVCYQPKPSPTRYSLWDWIISNNLLLFGSWDWFTYLGFKKEEMKTIEPHCITPLPHPPAPPAIFTNVKVRVELRDPQTRIQKVSRVRGIPILSSSQKIERDSIRTVHIFHMNRVSYEGHVVVELQVPDSNMLLQHLATLSVSYSGMPERYFREETISIQRNIPSMETKLPLLVVYHPIPSQLAAQNEHYVHMEIAMKRISCSENNCPQNSIMPIQVVNGMELIFQKHPSHSISPSFIPMKLNGTTVSVNLVPWNLGDVKRVAFDVRMPPTVSSTTQLIMKNPKILYYYKANHFNYPMEIELLEQHILRQ